MSERDSDSERPRAKDEFREALDHFKAAAQILLDRATHDPTLRTAANEAERVIQKLGSRAERVTGESVSKATEEAERVIQRLGQSAEPMAQKLGSEISKLMRRVGESVARAAPSDDDTD